MFNDQLSRLIACFLFLYIGIFNSFIYAEGPETWTFVSIPDFVNTDLGTLVGYPGYPDGWKDSTTAGFEATLASYLDAIATENPDLVLVAGDLVEGEWHHDTTNRDIFGTYGSHAARQAALDNAADLYYSQWVDRFTSRGLVAYPAVGDHELGDNNWGSGGNRARLVPDFKEAFARYFTLDTGGSHKFPMRPVGTPYEDTSYAFQNKNILFISIDVFRQDDPYVTLDSRTGSVLATVDGDHLAWLDSVLTAADNDPTIDHVIVQAHSPVLTPVRVRGSSELYLRDYDGTTNASNADKGADTDFWKTLAAHDVDFFFAGEVHHNTLSISDGVIQIVHDGIPYSSGNYLLGTVTGEKIDFEIKHISIGQGTEKFWQTVSSNKTEILVYGSSWETVATATYDKSSGTKILSNMTGELIPYGTNDGSIQGAPVELNQDFENPQGTSFGIVTYDVPGWTQENANKVCIDREQGNSAPADASQTLRFHNSAGTAVHQDLFHDWKTSDIYTLSFDSFEAGWRIGIAGDAVQVQLRQTDGTVLWQSEVINIDDTITGTTGNITWTGNPHSFSYQIYARDFVTGTPGSELNLRFARSGGVVWIDNVDFSVTMGLYYDLAGSDGDHPDGVVNLYDFARFAVEWLDCRIIPVDACD